MSMLVSIVIPVYNEVSLVDELVSRVSRVDTSPYDKEIVIIDDGSTDGTATVLDRLKENDLVQKVLHLEENRGKCAALREGFNIAAGEIIIVQDADLEYSPEEYPRLLAPFAEREVSVVYGSRFLKTTWPEKMMLHNWLANRFFTLLVNLLFGVHITDEGTAYKVFRADTLKGLSLHAPGFAFCAEVTCKLGQRRIGIREVPISYRARGVREGKKPRFYDGLLIVKTIVGIRLGLIN